MAEHRGLLSWNIGHGWSRWHIEVGDRTRCGLPIPTAGRKSYSSEPAARVTPDTLCHTCVLLMTPDDIRGTNTWKEEPDESH